MSKPTRLLLLWACLAGAVSVPGSGCASPPREGCAAREGEGSVDIHCDPSDTEAWQQDAIDEAEEGFEKRSPRGRAP